MSQDVIEFVCSLDSEKAETQLALQCAPLIMGLKISNMFTINNSQLRRVKNLLQGSRIKLFLLCTRGEKSTVFLYNEELFAKHLKKRKIWEFMKRYGYYRCEPEYVLVCFQRRYKSYREGRNIFPDELGVLLGYPLEDVEGYVKNEGRDALYTGYWKVYEEVQEKKEIFRMFELARETLLQLMGKGMKMSEIIETFC